MDKCKWKDGVFNPCDKHYKKWSRMQTPFAPLSEWSFCPFCGADIRKPVEIKPGMFGLFNDDTGDSAYGILYEIDSVNDNKWYIDNVGTSWECFTPGLPEWFNQDGTPK